MMKLDYVSLNSLVRSKVPYRGTNEYPMDNRSNRTNIVKLVETETDIEFHVCHGYEYVRTPITKELYEKLDGVQNVRVTTRQKDGGAIMYEKYSTTPRVLCIVRSDNSLEYTCDYYHQGDSMKMSDWSNGYQYQSIRMGGNAYWCSSSKMNHPIFKGLRINQETREPIGMDVKVFRRSVNRKKAMELMRGYKEAFTIPDKLLHCMDTDTMLVSVIDILQDKLPASGGRNSTRIGVEYTSSAQYFKVAEECLANNENFEALVLYAMSSQIRGFNLYTIENIKNGNQHHRITEPNNVVHAVSRYLSKQVYEHHKPFDEEEVPFNKVVRSSRWGLRVEVNGVDVVR